MFKGISSFEIEAKSRCCHSEKNLDDLGGEIRADSLSRCTSLLLPGL